MATRPTRPGQAPTPAPSPADGHEHADFEALRSQHEALVRQRSRLELLHEQAAGEVRACEQEAKALGVGSLKDLDALIERTKAEDERAMASFQAAVESEQQLQARVMAELEAIDSQAKA